MLSKRSKNFGSGLGVRNFDVTASDFLLFLQPRKTVLLASCTHVEMLVILCFRAVTCKIHVRLFEATAFYQWVECHKKSGTFSRVQYASDCSNAML